MECGTRKRRTLAERRESDKLRQRRFRARKRELANSMKDASGDFEESPPKKGRPCASSRKTPEQIRETNRIRQQRFRAKKREIEDGSIEETLEEILNPRISSSEDQQVLEEEEEFVETKPDMSPSVPETISPVDIFSSLQAVILQAARNETDRQTEIRREKDRIRKRRERQRKKEKKVIEDNPKFDEQLSKLKHEMLSVQNQWNHNNEEVESPVTLVKQEPDDPEEDVPSSSANGFSDSDNLMSTLEQMKIILGMGVPADDQPPESSDTPTSSPTPPFFPDELQELMEKKPWQRCSNSEERRERERMRKRMYRAKQKFISTGRLEMRWDPTPMTRTPNEDEEGVTPIPEWTKNLSAEQKLAAHRIYNKRYRERIKNEQKEVREPDEPIPNEQSEESEAVTSSESTEDLDFSNRKGLSHVQDNSKFAVSPEILHEIMSTFSQQSSSFQNGIRESDE